MDQNEILNKVDHTLLTQTATWDDIKKICDDAIKYHAKTVCIPPCYVKRVKENYKDSIEICTVIGFPNGYNKTEVKAFETEEAIKDGADEIDMVININALKNKDYDYILNEIKALKIVCKEKVLKVIIETCLLNDDEKVKMCKIIKNAGADYIKTSTGFSTSGATFDDVKLFKDNLRDTNVKIKAAGGIKSFDDAKKFIELGADRLGTSRLIKILDE